MVSKVIGGQNCFPEERMNVIKRGIIGTGLAVRRKESADGDGQISLALTKKELFEWERPPSP